MTDDLPIAVVHATDTGCLTVLKADAGGGNGAVRFGRQLKSTLAVHPVLVKVEMFLLLLVDVGLLH